MAVEVGIDYERLLNDPGSYAQEFCGISSSDLRPEVMEETLADHTSTFSYVIAEYEVERRRMERMKARMDTIKAQEFQRIQDEEDLAIGRTRERVKQLSRVTAFRNDLEDQRDRVSALSALVDALRDRRQMLIQIAKRQSTEAEHY